MYAFDKINENQEFKSKIKKIAIEIIDCEHSFWRKQWDCIGAPVCKVILSRLLSKDSKQGLMNLGFLIVGTLHGLYELRCIITEVYNQLLKKFSVMD